MRRLHSGRLRRIYETAFPSPTVGRTRAGHRRIRSDARRDFGFSDWNSAPHWRKREQRVLRCGKLNESIAVPGRLSRHPTGWRNLNFTSHWFERSSPLVRAAMTASDHDLSEREIAAPSRNRTIAHCSGQHLVHLGMRHSAVERTIRAGRLQFLSQAHQ